MCHGEREDSDEPYLVLSIDGEGFKGLACLLILAYLVEQISGENDNSDERGATPPPRPCQIFDLVCGTSAGGLIAILLGRFGLSCGEAIEAYRELGATMFGGETDSKEIWRHVIQDGHLSSESFERKLEELVEKYTGRKDGLFRPLSGAPDTVLHDSTKTLVTVVSRVGTAGVDAYRIRSYRRPLNDIDPPPYGHKWTLLEGARGTCAIPLYLSPLKISSGHSTFTFQDAGYSGFNNPAEVAIDEAEKLFGTDATIVLVSLGTGLHSLVHDAHGNDARKEAKERFAQHVLESASELGRNTARDAPEVAKRMAKQLLEVASDTEIAHLHAHERFQRLGQRHNYHRFNPPQGLGDVDPTDYRQEHTISSITDAWLKSPAGRAAISAATERLKDHSKVKQATKGRLGADGVSKATQRQSEPLADHPTIAGRTSDRPHNQALPFEDTTSDAREVVAESAKDQDGFRSQVRGRWSALVKRLSCHIDSERVRQIRLSELA